MFAFTRFSSQNPCEIVIFTLLMFTENFFFIKTFFQNLILKQAFVGLRMVLQDITSRKSLSKKAERKRIQSRNQIFVMGLPRYLSRGSIEQYFERFGQIKVKTNEKLVYLFTDKHGNFDGRCKVTYEREETARNVVDLLHDEDYKDTGCVLNVSMALVNYFGQKNVVRSSTDWICEFCSDKVFKTVNFQWQKSCYNCQRLNRGVLCNSSESKETLIHRRDDAEFIKQSCDKIKTEKVKEVSLTESEPEEANTNDYVEKDISKFSPVSSKRKSDNSFPIHTKIKKFTSVEKKLDKCDPEFTRVIEKEMEDVLLNTFMNYKMFHVCFPLSVKISVSKHIKRESPSKASKQKIHVNLQVSDAILKLDEKSTEPNDEIVMKVEKINEKTDDRKNILEDIIEEDIKSTQSESEIDLDFDSPVCSFDSNSQRKKWNNFEDDLTSKLIKSNEADSLTNHSHTSQTSIENTLEKGRKKFTFDQDKEILDKVIEVLPGRSLASLELSDPVLQLLSNSMSRCGSSISSRWKFSLRVWLIQYYSKNHKSWKNFGKASFNRRKYVANYFHKLVKKKGIKIEVMNATTK